MKSPDALADGAGDLLPAYQGRYVGELMNSVSGSTVPAAASKPEPEPEAAARRKVEEMLRLEKLKTLRTNAELTIAKAEGQWALSLVIHRPSPCALLSDVNIAFDRPTVDQTGLETFSVRQKGLLTDGVASASAVTLSQLNDVGSGALQHMLVQMKPSGSAIELNVWSTDVQNGQMQMHFCTGRLERQ